MLAFKLIDEYRKAHGLKFKIVNQIHDAIIFQTPIDEVEATIKMINETMGSIVIPIPDAPLVLAVDVQIMNRWGEKAKE